MSLRNWDISGIYPGYFRVSYGMWCIVFISPVVLASRRKFTSLEEADQLRQRSRRMLHERETVAQYLLNRTKELVRSHVNFLILHVAYVVLVSLLGGLVLWLIERDGSSFIDALLNATSAACVVGLSASDISKYSIASKVVLMILVTLGSVVFMSLVPVLIRRYYFAKYFKKKEDRERLAPEAVLEYKALKKLSMIVSIYGVVVQLAGFILLGIWFSTRPQVVERRGLNGWWWSIFHSVSAFNNAGFGLFSDNMVPLQREPGALLLLCVLITLGNTAFPLALRFIIFVRYKFLSSWDDQDVYEYMLKNPRQCFTHLFPTSASRWLAVALSFFLFGQWLLILVLDWNSAALRGIPRGDRVVNGLFQSVSTRTAGFNSIDLSATAPAMQFLYLVLMYLSAYPVALALRSSDVFSANPNAPESDQPAVSSEHNSVKSQAVAFLARDITALVCAVFLILVFEEKRLQRDPIHYGMFRIIFEVVSAYGTVGLTLGFPSVPYSFVGVWRTPSKFIVILVMLMGRHRGLPVSIDQAVRLKPSQYRKMKRTVEVKSRPPPTPAVNLSTPQKRANGGVVTRYDPSTPTVPAGGTIPDTFSPLEDDNNSDNKEAAIYELNSGEGEALELTVIDNNNNNSSRRVSNDGYETNSATASPTVPTFKPRGK